MKKLIFAGTVMAGLFFASSAFAQLTGPSLLQAVSNDLSRLPDTRVEQRGNSLVLRDSRTNAEIFTVSESGAQIVTLSGVVGDIGTMSSERKQMVEQHLAYFNYSSAVGTIALDNQSGQVTMYHHLNARLVSPANIVNVAQHFTDAMRAETVVFVQ